MLRRRITDRQMSLLMTQKKTHSIEIAEGDSGFRPCHSLSAHPRAVAAFPGKAAAGSAANGRPRRLPEGGGAEPEEQCGIRPLGMIHELMRGQGRQTKIATPRA